MSVYKFFFFFFFSAFRQEDCIRHPPAAGCLSAFLFIVSRICDIFHPIPSSFDSVRGLSERWCWRGPSTGDNSNRGLLMVCAPRREEKKKLSHYRSQQTTLAIAHLRDLLLRFQLLSRTAQSNS